MNIHEQNLIGINSDPAVPPDEAVLGNGQKKQHNHQLFCWDWALFFLLMIFNLSLLFSMEMIPKF